MKKQDILVIVTKILYQWIGIRQVLHAHLNQIYLIQILN